MAEKIKFETIEETYRRLVKEGAKTDPSLASLQDEIETDDWLRENDPSYDWDEDEEAE